MTTPPFTEPESFENKTDIITCIEWFDPLSVRI